MWLAKKTELGAVGPPGAGPANAVKSERIRSMPVTREEVIWAYKMFLGREPESESSRG